MLFRVGPWLVALAALLLLASAALAFVAAPGDDLGTPYHDRGPPAVEKATADDSPGGAATPRADAASAWERFWQTMRALAGGAMLGLAAALGQPEITFLRDRYQGPEEVYQPGETDLPDGYEYWLEEREDDDG